MRDLVSQVDEIEVIRKSDSKVICPEKSIFELIVASQPEVMKSGNGIFSIRTQ
jgi:hypothetical protein